MTPNDSTFDVLVVDDSASNREILKIMLERFGGRVETACDGLDAIARASARSFDLILLDVMMPRVDGCTAARAIRRQEGGLRRTPIIALTADEATREECLASGMDDFLSKPVHPVTLRAVLERWTGTLESSVIIQLGDSLGGPNSEQFKEIVVSFLDEAPRRLAILKEAADRGQEDLITSEAHALKGTSSYFGARRLETLCRHIEQLARQHSLEDIAACVAALNHEFERVRSALASPPCA